MVKFTCVSCNKAHSVDDLLSGKQAQCSCGSVITIPPPKKSGRMPIVLGIISISLVFILIFYFGGFINYYKGSGEEIIDGYIIRHENWFHATLIDQKSGKELLTKAIVSNYHGGILACNNAKFFKNKQEVSESTLIRNMKDTVDEKNFDQIIQDCYYYKDGKLLSEGKQLDNSRTDVRELSPYLDFIKQIRDITLEN